MQTLSVAPLRSLAATLINSRDVFKASGGPLMAVVTVRLFSALARDAENDISIIRLPDS